MLDYWAALEPVSIAGALIARGYAQPLTFGPNVALTIPLRDPANRGSMRPAWGSEGSTIPVVRGGLTSKTFNRHRLGAISVFSQELAKVATPSIAALIQSSILEDMAAAIDAELFGEFDAIAGVRPASLNTGVTPITTTNDPLQDIVAVLSAVTVNRPRRPVFIRGTEDAMKLRVHRADGEWIFRTELERSGTVLSVPLIASANLPQSEIICLDGAALMMGLGLPEIDQSSEATVVMLGADGVDPSMAPSGQPDVVTEASSVHVSDASGVTGGPAEVRGMLQTAGEAIRVVQDGLDWAMMDSDLIARVSTAGW